MIVIETISLAGWLRLAALTDKLRRIQEDLDKLGEIRQKGDAALKVVCTEHQGGRRHIMETGFRP